MEIELNAEELAELRKPVSGQGGFQSFLRALRRRSAAGGMLRLSPTDLERVKRYAFDYGNGGWEGRLRAMFERHLGPNLDGGI